MQGEDVDHDLWLFSNPNHPNVLCYSYVTRIFLFINGFQIYGTITFSFPTPCNILTVIFPPPRSNNNIYDSNLKKI